ncbi:MAG: molybdopterin-dependent oxidoreductase [Saprospiraceae bacterium]|nr:molybdopterin-dependent oxidoreductase [Saprospiraceae bacterium]MDG2417723.1 molybdopterin-dependent oxidoreductase [Saprospiraceae bacterium]
MDELKKHYRTCNLCEAMCGIEITYRDKEIKSIKGDPKDPLSEGHICPKAIALQDIYNDPDRLKTPLRKKETGEWEEISWDVAYEEISTKIKSIQKEFGVNAVGSYLGNPNAHNFGNGVFLPLYLKALGTNNRYSSASADQLPHHFASNFMFGHGLIMPIPDIDRTDFMLIIGGNPMVSNGSMMTAPNFSKRMKRIQERGGKIVVVDPRRTETARKSNEHIFIRPERDALLLLGLIKTIQEKGLVNLRHLRESLFDFEKLDEITKDFSLEKIASIIGISVDKIESLATEFVSAPSAVCYSRMGASTQLFGGLCQWLTNVLNIISGNFDRAGGAMFTQPAFDVLKITNKKGKLESYGRYRSRVRNLPYYNSEFPVSTLADEILTEGDGQIKAMICIAGNPVLSSPNGERLASALSKLDFMVSVDIYLNETSRHADIILPVATGLEIPHFDIFFNIFSVKNTVKYSPPLFEKRLDQKYDWEILRKFISILTDQPESQLTPEYVLDNMLQSGIHSDKGLNLEMLKQHPHGIDLGALQPCLVNRLQTNDDKIRLAPQILVDDLARLKSTFFSNKSLSNEFPFQMIGRRLLRSHNTWMHNSYRLVKGKNECTMILNPRDAEALQIQNGDIVKVTSKVGSIEIETQLSDEIMEGVVSIPQGWGHGRKGVKMKVAQEHPGISINELTDHERIDELTGNAALNGVGVRVESLVSLD